MNLKNRILKLEAEMTPQDAEMIEMTDQEFIDWLRSINYESGQKESG